MSTTARLGMFLAATLLILSAGIFLIGSNESMFTSTYRVKTEFHNVAGLNDGADVRVGGIRMGVVSKINLPNRPDGSVTVVMNLQSATRDIVKADSIAAIHSEGLLGDQYVDISFGSVNAPRLKDGGTIQSEPPFEFSELMKKTNGILDSAQGAVTNIEETASNLSSISAKINQGQGTAGALINDKTVYKQAAAGATAMQEDMEALKHNFLLRGFFKDRGYEDASDLTKYEIPNLPAGPSLKVFRYDPKQIFDKPDTAKLKNEKAFHDAGSFLEKETYGLAVVVASGGMKGDTDKERKLTEARSMVIRESLVNNFRLDDKRIKTMGLGKSTEPDADANVEIVIYPDSAKSR